MDLRDWQLDPEVGSIVHDVARLMRVAFERRIRHLGLTRTQWWVMMALLRLDGATQTELAAFMQMERSPLGKVIDILERDKWLERRADPADRRVKRIFRTGKIEDFLPGLAAAASAVFDEATTGMDPEARKLLTRDLGLMKRNLAALVDDPYEEERAPAAS